MLNILSRINLGSFLGIAGTLKRQLSISFLAVGLAPLLVISVVALMLFSNMTSQQIFQNLEALKSNKVVAIEEYGNTIVNQVLTASEDPNLSTNMLTLIAEFDAVRQTVIDIQETSPDKLDNLRQALGQYYQNEFAPTYKAANNGADINAASLLNRLSDEAIILQYAYIQQNPASLGNKHEMFRSALNIPYDDIHDLMHQTFKGFLEKFGYYDIFLVDTQGRVIYSVYKELDYATNLLNGPYANTGIAKAFESSLAITRSEYALIDYAQYTPSYEAPASFIASPIFAGNKRLGALIFQMPLDAITNVMSERRGLGETGESFLVGEDRLLRSDSLKFPDEYSVNESFRKNLRVNTDSVELGLKGKSGVIETENYKQESVVSGYIPVNFGSLKWVMIAEMETQEAFAGISHLRWIVLLICLVAIAGIITVSMKTSDRILQPILKMKEAINQIALETDFSVRAEVHLEDEIGESVMSLNALLQSVEVSIKETNAVVKSMSQGNFKQRVKADFKGDLLDLKKGVNSSADAMEQSISAANTVLKALAMGDFSQTINIELEGDLNRLKQGVNSSNKAIAEAFHSLSDVMKAMSVGNFKYRAKGNLVGDYRVIADQADATMESIDKALSEIDSVMFAVSKGNLDARVLSDLPGQLCIIKDNLNASLNEIDAVFRETVAALHALSEGKLYQTIESDFPGSFQLMKTSANATAKKLQEVVREIQQTATTVRQSAGEIAAANSSLSQRTEHQASNLEQTAASMDEITSTVKNTATNAIYANKIAVSAKEQATKGGQVVTEAMAAMKEINTASSRIADIISVIDSIAFQTNLLALNAAVEAARAGDQGKGFAVVAGEVRNLAGRSSNAAREIKTLIDDSVKKVKVGSGLVEKSGATLQEIIAQVDNVNSIVSEISTAADEQSVGVAEVHKAVESLQSLTQQNSAMVEEATAASEDLDHQANSMSDLMLFFSLDASNIVPENTAKR